ncbi:radical SAM/SPASM domain-containing protein [Futiania mangrovi]|uniref:SPASM domain-containing protein n=1 Tax=Futiania mangrovi TaxID=2959716 RepID=A0A9J6PC00_9PROT|nr:radical SAM/SPASM domain-containing protein [Futiania mangrovii]MCP1336789.1 SPASM domain-containing protein [Futiania mangrovii]
MESIYYSISWVCHRRCVHCYEDRFRPYVRDELKAVIGESLAAWPKIVANMPARMTYLDLADPLPEGGYREKTGRIILSGGEVLHKAVRKPVLYPILEALQEKYGSGGVKVVVQTTGDLLTQEIVADLLARGVWMISVAGMDDFHVGLEGDKRVPLQEKLTRWFEAAGMVRSGLKAATRQWHEEDGPLYSFFGATEDAWIGKIWPRGRAWTNDLSRAEITDNFCNAWSGGLNFLNHGYSGSEVAVDADGNVYPCCMKTKLPIGNLTEETVEEILDDLAGHPVYEAISMGHPERMGLAHGWDMGRFLEESETVTPGGRPYRNLCIGCDRFHEKVLGPVIRDLREKRRARRMAAAAE